MTNRSIATKMFSATFIAATTLFLGCALDETQASLDEDLLESQAAELTYTRCAEQNGVCNVSGSAQVRYGANGRYTTRTVTGSIRCSNWAFRVNYGRRGNACDIVSETSSPPEHDHDTDHDTDHDMDHGADAGTSAGSGGTNMDPGMAHMPTIDRSKIPTGSAGASTVNIRSTSELPGASDGTGAFRQRCEYSHMNFDDAIVYPGQPGKAHLHAYFGNTGANAYSTPSSLRNSGNSTCRGGIANRSAYWVPSVIDAAGAPVKPVALDVYYKTGYNGIDARDVRAFPSGLRMIAGDMRSSSTQTNAFWGCQDNYIGRPGSIPNCPAGDHVLMTVVFPQCWDGVNLDSADHKSHMAYTRNGGCPSTHPVAIPEITFNTYYAQPGGGTSGWRLSSDMYEHSKPGGFSGHADYFEAWDPAVVNAFVRNCNNAAVDCRSHLLGDGRAIF